MRKLLLASVFSLVAGVASAQVQNNDSIAYIEQTASTTGVTATQDQTGYNNQARAFQQDSVRTSSISQTQTGSGGGGGTGNRARATQNGNGQDNAITQTQRGTNNKVEALQPDGLRNRIFQTQEGTAHVSYAYQGGGRDNLTVHDQSGNGGDSNFNTASSYMTNQVSSQQYVTQTTGGNTATQNMMSAGSNNLQQIVQNGQGGTATQTLR